MGCLGSYRNCPGPARAAEQSGSGCQIESVRQDAAPGGRCHQAGLICQAASQFRLTLWRPLLSRAISLQEHASRRSGRIPPATVPLGNQDLDCEGPAMFPEAGTSGWQRRRRAERFFGRGSRLPDVRSTPSDGGFVQLDPEARPLSQLDDSVVGKHMFPIEFGDVFKRTGELRRELVRSGGVLDCGVDVE